MVASLGKVYFDARELFIDHVTIKVRITHADEMTWRLRAGIVMLDFAARVMGCKLDVKVDVK